MHHTVLEVILPIDKHVCVHLRNNVTTTCTYELHLPSTPQFSGSRCQMSNSLTSLQSYASCVQVRILKFLDWPLGFKKFVSSDFRYAPTPPSIWCRETSMSVVQVKCYDPSSCQTYSVSYIQFLNTVTSLNLTNSSKNEQRKFLLLLCSQTWIWKQDIQWHQKWPDSMVVLGCYCHTGTAFMPK